MGQSLRLNFENKDHTFRILNTEPITRETKALLLLLDGQSLTIVKEGELWILEKPVTGVTVALVNAAVKNIKLRFRI